MIFYIYQGKRQFQYRYIYIDIYYISNYLLIEQPNQKLTKMSLSGKKLFKSNTGLGNIIWRFLNKLTTVAHRKVIFCLERRTSITHHIVSLSLNSWTTSRILKSNKKEKVFSSGRYHDSGKVSVGVILNCNQCRNNNGNYVG